MLTIKAPAKINWFLEVKGKRPDGFHEVETVMQSIGLFDEITVENADELALTCNIDLGDPRQNLVFRAAEILRREYAAGHGARISLNKQIPHGAGLGGGSSDAANALVALNRLWGLGLDNDVLREIASRVGSDCPFFIEGGTAVCTGRGEIVSQMPDIAGIDLVVLYPNAVCPTAPVYRELSGDLTHDVTSCYLFHDLQDSPGAGDVAPLVMNRLQEPALRVSARMRDAWNRTAQERDVFVQFVSGSGSSVVFLLPNQRSGDRLAQSLRARQLGQVFVVKTLPRGAVWG
ncbi:MAG: 4-(cytidine 5'-diphospho)-2-C-methyl-D-erythritol kinase [Planctomycetes bacterium]|nr:4-(cytidine 5'-diphospho)-2-C-methyl-D-erythritol kinase [Planctomycetota bacterium]